MQFCQVHSSVHGCDSKGPTSPSRPRLKRVTKARRYLSLVPPCCFRKSAETTRRIAIMTQVLRVPFATSNSLNKQIFITYLYNEKDPLVFRSHEIEINSTLYSLMLRRCSYLIYIPQFCFFFCKEIWPIFHQTRRGKCMLLLQ